MIFLFKKSWFIFGLIGVFFVLALFSGDVFAQQNPGFRLTDFSNLLGTTLSRTLTQLTTSINLAALYLLTILATIDLVFYAIFNAAPIMQQGIAVALPEIFRKLVIWVVLIYGINNFSGVEGAREIRNIAGSLTNAAVVELLTPTSTLKLGLRISQRVRDAATQGVADGRSKQGFWESLFEDVSFQSLLFFLTSFLAQLAVLFVFTYLALRIFLFQLGTSVTMAFIGIAFALGALAPFRSWSTNAIQSAIRLVINLAAIYVVALFLIRALTRFGVSIEGATFDVLTGVSFNLIILVVAFIGFYLARVLPELVSNLLSGGAGDVGRTGSDVATAGALLGAAKALGSAAGGLSAAAKVLAGDGDDDDDSDDGGGGDDGLDDGQDSNSLGRTGGDSNSLASGLGPDADSDSSGSNRNKGTSPSGGSASGGGGSPSGGGSNPVQEASLANAFAPDEDYDAPFSDENFDDFDADEEFSEGSTSQASGSGSQSSSSSGSGGSIDLSDDSDGGDDSSKSTTKASSVTETVDEDITINTVSGGQSVSTVGGGDGDADGIDGEGGGGANSDVTSTRESTVTETVNDNIRVDKRAGSNSVQGNSGDDGENEAAIAATSSSSGSSSTVDVSTNNNTTVVGSKNNSDS